MFCHITQNWRGKPLVSHEVIVNLIAATTTKAGLSIRSGVDDHEHAAGIKVSDDQMEAFSIRQAGFHGEWNYTLLPPHTNGQFILASFLRACPRHFERLRKTRNSRSDTACPQCLPLVEVQIFHRMPAQYSRTCA